jgi:hypothetical protein
MFKRDETLKTLSETIKGKLLFETFHDPSYSISAFTFFESIPFSTLKLLVSKIVPHRPQPEQRAKLSS